MNNNNNIFEIASRLKIRFQTDKGLLTVEDLWALPLTKLDALARAANKQLKAEDEESFIVESVAKDKKLEVSFELLKHVIKVRMEENKNAKVSQQRLEELNMLKDILANKKNEELHSMPIDEIEKRIAELTTPNQATA